MRLFATRRYAAEPFARHSQSWGSRLQNDILIDKTLKAAYFENQRDVRSNQWGNEAVPNRLKSLMRQEQPAIGCWVGFADPYSVELMGDLGFDWLLIDTEHIPLDRQSLRTILMSLKGSSSTAVVRLPSNSRDHYQTALDLGAQGVVVPMVNSREEAAQAVDYCRYPPVGTRGFSPTRASRYFQDLENYAREANDQVALIVQVETPQSVENIGEIVTMDQVDGIFIGPGDLASFMNLATQIKHPQVEGSVDRIIDAARAHRMPFGLPTWSLDECLGYVRRGACLPTIGSDLSFMANAARTSLSGMRIALQKSSTLTSGS
jgi:2-keto-3-deoxy-L-rhamnonate aldolase RhmA